MSSFRSPFVPAFQAYLADQGFLCLANHGFTCPAEQGFASPAFFLRRLSFSWAGLGTCLYLESWTCIFLPHHDLPLASSTAFSASWMELNLTKANPLFLPLFLSMGMKESRIFPPLQNIASSSVFDISSDMLDTNKENEFSLIFRILRGREGLPRGGLSRGISE